MKPLFARLFASLLAFCALPAFAATPATGSVSPQSPTLDFESDSFATTLFCAADCDTFELTAELPADLQTTDPLAMLRFGFAWAGKLDIFFTFTLTDLDTGEVLTGSSSSDLGSQTIYIPAGQGVRRIKVGIAALAPSQSVILGRISLIAGDSAGLRPNPVGPGVPRYQIYTPPPGLNGNTGEPSIGYSPSSKQAFILSGLKTLWAVFPQDQTPAQPQACEAAWEERSSAVTSITSLDPIGITDSLVRGHETNRTIIGQLAGANSAAAYSDDNGATWIPVEGGPPISAIDHQTYGAGPYPANFPIGGLVPNPIYPNAVYYCGQDIAFASCARSDNGGITFGPATVAYTVQQCAGIHGHVRVSPDGTVYIPSKACGTGVAVTVSEDAGTTWSVRPVPDSRPSIRDPSVGLASDSTAYFCYSNGDGRATVSVSKDRGLSWEAPVELGAEMGIKHVMFTHALAGDGDRAVCAYVGTTTVGNPTALDFPGTWHVYFSSTYDGGKTWTTVNATPEDTVQGVGGIWNSGGGSQNRNLLDFNELSIDERGYPMYGYADGCISDCDVDPTLNTFAAYPKIVRQIAGKSLYAEFDQPEPRAPAPACLAGQRTPERAALSWRVPEHGGAAITSYKIFRGLAPGAEELIGTTDGTPSFLDITADPAVPTYFYKVTALNAAGEGIASNVLELPVETLSAATSCGIPGLRLADDAPGDAQLPNVDLISLHVSEPPEMPDQLIFQLKVSDLAQTPPTTMWSVLFNTPDLPTSGSVQAFVGMVSAPGGVQFVHGTNNSTALVVAGYQEVTVVGSLDPASGFSPDGTIQLVVPRSLFGLEPGDSLAGLSIRTHAGATATGTHLVRSTNTLDSAEALSSYAIRQPDACLPNTTPLAAFSATPGKAEAPVEVTLDASASSDAEDRIVEYVFDFGDRTPPVTQTTPVATHRYTEKGFYRVTLQVKDARGAISQNVAQAVIDTTAPVTPPTVTPTTPVAPDDARFGGGALPAALLLWLLLPAIRRKLASGV